MPDEVKITLERTGQELRNIEDFSCSQDFMRGPDTFDATVYDEPQLTELVLEPVSISVNGQPIMYGRIERVSRGAKGTAVDIGGRDFRGDMMACQVDPTLKILKDMTLDEAILKAASPAGITAVTSDGVLGIRNVLTGGSISAPAPVGFKDAKLQDYAPHPGETIWSFCSKMCERFGATIQPGLSRGQLALAAPSYDQDVTFSLTRIAEPGRSTETNVLTTSVTQDLGDVPTFAIYAGKQWDSDTKKASDVSRHGPVTIYAQLPDTGRLGDLAHFERVKPGDSPPDGKVYRLLYQKAEDCRSQLEVDAFFARGVTEMQRDSMVYEATIEGFTDRATGLLWAYDTLVDVHDEVCLVSRTMWVLSRKFSYSESSGATTDLRMLLLNTIVLS